MRSLGRAIVVLLAWLALTGPARASEAGERKAQALFLEGKAHFEGERYQEAYDAFKQAFLLAPKPALLYNMASALEALGRPHEAAEELRAYLRATPQTPERGVIEEHIRGLEEAQRLLDRERGRAPVFLPAPPVYVSPPPVVPLSVAPSPPRPSAWTRRKTVITVLSSVGALLAGAALGVGLGLGLQSGYTPSTLGVKAATQ